MLEYNIRFGDPDSQVVLLRLTTDLAAAARRGGRRRARAPSPTFDDGAAVLVVVRGRGLPRPPCAPATRSRGSTRPARVEGVDGVLRRRRRGRGRAARDRRGPGARRRRPRPRPGHRPGSAPTTASATSAGPACTTEPTSPTRGAHSEQLQGRHPDGLAQRPGQDAAGRRHARAVRHRGRRAGAVGAPHAGQGRRAGVDRPRERLRRLHLRRRAWPRTSPARSPPTPRCPSSACRCRAGRSTASTRSTPPCRCPRASRWPPSPSTARRTPRCSSSQMLAISDADLAQQLADHRVEIAGLSGARPSRVRSVGQRRRARRSSHQGVDQSVSAEGRRRAPLGLGDRPRARPLRLGLAALASALASAFERLHLRP